jgi:hypothetical protein
MKLRMYILYSVIVWCDPTERHELAISALNGECEGPPAFYIESQLKKGK